MHHRTRSLLPLLAWLAALLWLLASPAHAACNWAVGFAPAFPSTITASQTVGATIYNGTVTITTTGCTFNNVLGTASFQFGWGSSAAAIQGMTGLAAHNNGSVVLVSNGTTRPGATSMGANYSMLSFSNAANKPGNFQLSIGLVITATAAVVSGSLPSPQSPGLPLISGAAMLPSSACGWGWGSENIVSGAPVLLCDTYSISGFSGLNIVSNTCTVSTPAVAVGLPNVSKTSLAAAGSTAGITPFTLSFSGCSTSASGFTGTQTWAFTPGPASNVISNTGTATNVYAQILDSSMAPITNGGTTSFSVPAAGGAVSQQFYARYYSSGTAGAGTLNSTATFTMTYN